MKTLEEERFEVTISKCAETGQRLSQVWRNKQTGKIDYPYGPAETVFHPEQQTPRQEIYWLDGKVTREGAPAIIGYDEYGNIRQETYVINNGLHAEGKPSSKYFDENGEVTEAHYHRNGKPILKISVSSPS